MSAATEQNGTELTRTRKLGAAESVSEPGAGGGGEAAEQRAASRKLQLSSCMHRGARGSEDRSLSAPHSTHCSTSSGWMDGWMVPLPPSHATPRTGGDHSTHVPRAPHGARTISTARSCRPCQPSSSSICLLLGWFFGSTKPKQTPRSRCGGTAHAARRVAPLVVAVPHTNHVTETESAGHLVWYSRVRHTAQVDTAGWRARPGRSAEATSADARCQRAWLS